MTDKVLIIISTPDAGKAQTGAMYALNSLKYGWMENVKVILFGPAQDLILENEKFRDLIQEYQEIEENVVACKFISDRDEKSEELDKLGIQVKYVGEIISNYIKDGYMPMVW